MAQSRNSPIGVPLFWENGANPKTSGRHGSPPSKWQSWQMKTCTARRPAPESKTQAKKRRAKEKYDTSDEKSIGKTNVSTFATEDR